MRYLRFVTALLALVLLLVAVASIIASRQAYGQSTQYYRPGIQCAMAVQEFQRLQPLGYSRFATNYTTEYGPGYMLSVPVSYVFKNAETGDYRHVHCRGVARGPSKPLPVAVATGGE